MSAKERSISNRPIAQWAKVRRPVASNAHISSGERKTRVEFLRATMRQHPQCPACGPTMPLKCISPRGGDHRVGAAARAILGRDQPSALHRRGQGQHDRHVERSGLIERTVASRLQLYFCETYRNTLQAPTPPFSWHWDFEHPVGASCEHLRFKPSLSEGGRSRVPEARFLILGDRKTERRLRPYPHPRPRNISTQSPWGIGTCARTSALAARGGTAGCSAESERLIFFPRREHTIGHGAGQRRVYWGNISGFIRRLGMDVGMNPSGVGESSWSAGSFRSLRVCC